MFVIARYPLRVNRKIVLPANGPIEVPDDLGKKMIAAGIAAASGKRKNKSGN